MCTFTQVRFSEHQARDAHLQGFSYKHTTQHAHVAVPPMGLAESTRAAGQCDQNGIDPPGLAFAYLASCPLVEQSACQFRDNQGLPFSKPQ